jgi:hypothetical protein
MITTLKAFWAKLNSDVKALWADDKVFLILFGIVIFIVKFRNLLIDLLVSNANNTVTKADKKDASLAATESKDNAQADQLVQQAKEETAKEQPVDVNWYKK